jgi:WD40 repeat protein
LEPEIAADSPPAKNVQQELAHTSLCTVTAAIEIWYNPNPTSTIIEEDAVFVESFFAIPDEDVESKLHLQSPWLLRLELDPVAFSSDGRHIVSGSCDKSVRLWDLSTGETLKVLEGHTNTVTSVAFSPDSLVHPDIA